MKIECLNDKKNKLSGFSRKLFDDIFRLCNFDRNRYNVFEPIWSEINKELK